MSISLKQPLPFEVGQLGNFEGRMLRNFRAAVDDWDEVCSGLGAWEAEHLIMEDNLRNEQHRRWVSELLSWGRLVQRASQQPEFPDKTITARVDARIRPLEDRLALWHREMTPAEEESILLAAFK